MHAIKHNIIEITKPSPQATYSGDIKEILMEVMANQS
jgi:hypothetical protein